ncbi:MAG: tryptophan synthase subunit alpha [Desulfurispora sp.]|uniref:tryptophan synthase subunit alpha n=1 Tax=Desulfurispora sp. TaxID=3014275 RepID=UPI00404B9F4D
MNQKFRVLLEDLQKGRRKGFFPFLMAGYPNLYATVELAGILADAGADLLEIGLPFSDPMADGPLLQAAARQALQQGTRTADVLRVVDKIASRTNLPVLLMSYYNPVLQYGLEGLARDVGAAGASGLIVPDLPPEEAAPLKEQLQGRGLELIHFLAPTTPPERLECIVKQSTGFLYCLSVNGVTGLRQEIDTIMPKIITAVRRISPIPLAIGFGISSPDQAASLTRSFEAVIVGSALARVIADCEQKAAPAAPAIYRLACQMRRAIQV